MQTEKTKGHKDLFTQFGEAYSAESQEGRLSPNPLLRSQDKNLKVTTEEP
ncbi:hypothetical protein LINGRAPRIM_LOCUS585 [Linum grandiflorum]